MDQHKQAVAHVARRVRQFYDRKEKFRIYHGSTNSTRPKRLDPDKTVDTSALDHVLKINTDQKIVVVEPNVPMDRLVEATLKYGLVPPVVMEARLSLSPQYLLTRPTVPRHNGRWRLRGHSR